MAVRITSTKGYSGGSTPKNREVVHFWGDSDGDENWEYQPDFVIRKIAHITNFGTNAIMFEDVNFDSGDWQLSEIGGHPLISSVGPAALNADSDTITMAYAGDASDVSVLVEFRS